MFKDKAILVIVPARGGSKGIKLKNIQLLDNKPLVSITGHLIKELEYVDKAVISTDNEEIAMIAKKSGLEVPFWRPKKLSGDRIADWEVLYHALKECEKIDDKQYDIIVMLQPTSPMRKAIHVTKTIEKLIDGNYDAVWTVSETDSKHHPLKQLVIKNDELHYYDPEGAKIIARQQLIPLYHRNGVAYAITRDCIMNKKSIKGDKASAFIIDEQIVNIDTIYDLEYAEYIIYQQELENDKDFKEKS